MERNNIVGTIKLINMALHIHNPIQSHSPLVWSLSWVANKSVLRLSNNKIKPRGMIVVYILLSSVLIMKDLQSLVGSRWFFFLGCRPSCRLGKCCCSAKEALLCLEDMVYSCACSIRKKAPCYCCGCWRMNGRNGRTEETEGTEESNVREGIV